MLPKFSLNLTPQEEAFEITAQLNEKLKRTEFDDAFGIFFIFFAKRRKSEEKNDPSKEK